MQKANFISQRLKRLFDCFDDSMIQSCFEGVYGELWCDDEQKPGTAVIVSGDFLYLAGKPGNAGEIAVFLQDKPNAVIVPGRDEWFGMLDAACGHRLIKVQRYHMRAAKGGFDTKSLADLADKINCPQLEGYTLCGVGESEYRECLGSDWAYSFVSNFLDYEQFRRHGFGFVVKHGGRVVSGTSTKKKKKKGVEVEVSTSPEHRSKGLAGITAARFILECIHRQLAPNWDARNMVSVSIAKKLGFELHDTYTAYEFKE